MLLYDMVTLYVISKQSIRYIYFNHSVIIITVKEKYRTVRTFRKRHKIEIFILSKVH